MAIKTYYYKSGGNLDPSLPSLLAIGAAPSEDLPSTDNPFVAITVDDSNKPDLDEAMADLGFEFVVEAAAGIQGKVRAITFADSPYAPGQELVILANATGGAITISLPALATVAVSPRFLIVQKTDASANAVTLDPSGAETINGAATELITAQYGASQISSSPTEWASFQFGGGGGGENLAATLVIGNFTGGTNIQVDIGDEIQGDDAAGGSGLPGGELFLRGGFGDGVGRDGPIVLSPGTDGSVQADLGGNARGSQAWDFFPGPRFAPTAVASGDGAVLWRNARADGDRCFVTSDNSSCYGNDSFMCGFYNVITVAAPLAHVEGSYNVAQSPNAHVEGKNNTVNAQFSHAEGYYNRVGGPAASPYTPFSYGHAEGVINTVDAPYGPHAEGQSNYVGPEAFAVQSGLYARGGHAEGNSNLLNGNYAHAEGVATICQGETSHTQGNGTATGRVDAPFGGWGDIFQAAWDTYRAASDRPYAVAGFVNGDNTHAQNSFTEAVAPNSTSMGDKSVASVFGQRALSSGVPTTASRYSGGGVQNTEISLQGETNGAVSVTLFAGPPGTPQPWRVPMNKGVVYKVLLIASSDTTASAPGITEVARWQFDGLARRNRETQAGFTQGTGGSITVTGAPLPSVGDTITIGGPLGAAVVLTAVAGARTPGGGDFSLASGSAAGIAVSLRDAINDQLNGIRNLHISQATTAAAVVRLDAYPLGTAGNGVTLATSHPASFTLSGATLTGGVDAVVTLVSNLPAGPAIPVVSDAGLAAATANVVATAATQSLDIVCVGIAAKRIAWHASVYTSESGRNPV